MSKEEMEIAAIMDKYRDEAVKTAIQAFNEGYLLGRAHAEKVLGGNNED